MPTSASWLGAIEGFLRAQRSAGYPATTIYTRRQHLENLARGIGAGPFEVTPTQLRDWASTRDWAQETRRGRRVTFLVFWRWAVDEGLTDTNPAAALPKVRASEPHPRPVPDDVWERAVAIAPPRVRVMMRLASDAGMRRAEIAVVHSRDVFQDFDGWSIVVHGKGGKTRDVPLTPRLALELRSLPAGYAFPGAIDGHLSPRRVGELVNDVLEDDWTIHKIRHRAGDRVYRESRDLGLTQDFMGHASPATTRRYVRPLRDLMRGVVNAAAS